LKDARISNRSSLRNHVIVLGDQLDADSAAFDGSDPAKPAIKILI
jgi:hypothetical protein